MENKNDVFRPMRRFRQQVSTEECIRVLTEEKRGVLSMLGDNGYPYGIPMNHWYDPEEGKLTSTARRRGTRSIRSKSTTRSAIACLTPVSGKRANGRSM